MNKWATQAGAGERKPTLLFVDYAVPQYDLYAGSRTNFMYLKLLVGMGLEVKFLPADFLRVEPYSSELNDLGIETLDGDWYRENWEQWLKDNGQGIDYVFFNKPEPATAFLPAIRNCTRAAIIYQCHDLHYLRLGRKAEIENDQAMRDEADRYEQMEDRIFTSSDVLLTFSDVEEKILREKFPGKRVFTVPLFFYQDIPHPDRDFQKRNGLLFVGACSHKPNRDAIAWFCSEILPLVRRGVPGVEFKVVSAHAPAEIAALESDHVHILGRVSDDELQDLYDQSRLVVVPLRFGAGVKGKVIEALYQGVPIVSTGIGLEGIVAVEHLATARDDAAAFAEEIINLCKNDEKLAELSRQGSTYIAERFTTQAAAGLMSQILEASLEEAAPRLASTLPVRREYTPPRVIAFHLPQYHAIPENDEWWGEGFTDWHNVQAAQPQFAGHYQPHVPTGLGYYDLMDENVRAAQAELAEQYGIEGFCYYHYWFNGKRLLDRPLQAILASGEPSLPFCICWANENWTRRWDGKDQEILIQQNYSEEDDRQHIRTLLPILQDERYIRVNGKPLLMVYRTEIMPEPARTAEVWREEARAAGLGEIYLCRVESFSKCDPTEINFDAAVEFAPDWSNLGPRLTADSELLAGCGEGLEKASELHRIFDYQALSHSMMAKITPPYKWIRCVTPTWDNTARRKQDAFIFHDSTPEKYGAWLGRAIDYTDSHLSGEERLVFVNAWNEWAEGNHLEPDERYGHAYLEATKETLDAARSDHGSRQPGAHGVISMGHLAGMLEDSEIRRKELQARLEQKEQQIEEMLHSTSWRLTSPVRWLKERLLKLK